MAQPERQHWAIRTLLTIRPDDSAGHVGSSPDALVIDLGSGAIGPAASLLDGLRTGPARPVVYVRIPALDSGSADEALDAVMPFAPDGIVLARAIGVRDVEHLGSKLAVREAEHGLVDGVTRIVAMIGAAGVLSFGLGGMAATARLAAIGYDPAALEREIGCHPGAPALVTAASLTILAAAAAGVPALASTSSGPADDARARFEAWIREGFEAVLVSRECDVAAANAVFRDRGQTRVGRAIENFVSGVATK